jgi:hypothetical protein
MTVLPGGLEEVEVAEVQPRVLAAGRSVEVMGHKALLSSIRSDASAAGRLVGSTRYVDEFSGIADSHVVTGE